MLESCYFSFASFPFVSDIGISDNERFSGSLNNNKVLPLSILGTRQGSVWYMQYSTVDQ